MSSPPSVYTERFRVRGYEVDPYGRAGLPTLGNYFQEVAGNHATALGLATDQLDGLAWVLARLRVEVGRYPGWREELTFETWPSDVDRLYAFRDFVCRDAEDRLVLRGVSTWMLINPETRRPARMPPVVTRLRRPDRPRALPDPESTPTGVNDPERRVEIGVRLDDLDMMRHVNNTRYLAWVLESVPPGLFATHEPAGADIAFRAEASYGDALVSECASVPGEDQRFLHQIVHTSDGRIAARATSRWRLRTDG